LIMNAARSVTATFGASTTVTTAPSGLQIIVDGSTLIAPQTFVWIPGSSHTVGVPPVQGSGGTRAVFTSWNDGQAQSHTVTASAAATYTASFQTQHLLSTAVSPAGLGTVTASPASADGFYNNGTAVLLTAAGAFRNWSGDLSGSANPQSVLMSAPRSVTANFEPLPLTSPTLTYSVPGALGPAQQQPVQLNVSTTYSGPIAGQLTLTFVPNAVNNVDDPNVMFTNGSRRVDFTIPAK
jgi:hypothetical protein